MAFFMLRRLRAKAGFVSIWLCLQPLSPELRAQQAAPLPRSRERGDVDRAYLSQKSSLAFL